YQGLYHPGGRYLCLHFSQIDVNGADALHRCQSAPDYGDICAVVHSADVEFMNERSLHFF
ncbi:MAG TPA: hypothetical protein VHK91_04120, partial [Flavisolibacter sp.]|nr:hypothetical protein [Flavisolibacter sp.]